MNKKKIILVTLAVLAVVSGLVLYNLYINSRQTVTLNYDRELFTLSLYDSDEVDHVITKKGSSIKMVAPGEVFTLSKGTYVIEPSGENIKADPIILPVGDTPVNQTIEIPYSDTLLKSSLATERDQIMATLTRTLPANLSLYIIEPGKLYKRGEWYATTLTYKNKVSESRDTLRLVMKKEADRWSLATKPPQISLSSVIYKDIPKDILSDINKLGKAPQSVPAASKPKPRYFIENP